MKKILVVDDCKTITDLVKLILESSGYSCSTANSATECLSLLRTKRFDLILLDIAMPEVSGIDMLKNAKEDGTPLIHTRIVLFTASSLTDAQLNDLKNQYGVLDCIKKPMTRAKLLEVVGRCLSESVRIG